MLKAIRFLACVLLIGIGTGTNESLWGRGFGGLRGGAGLGGMAGGRLSGFAGGGGLGTMAAGRLGGFGGGAQLGGLTGGGELGELARGRLNGLEGGQLGGGQLGLRSQLADEGGGRLDALEGRLQDGGGALGERLPGLGSGQLAGLADGSRLDSLSGRIPSGNELSKFLGIPSDNGLHHLSGETQSRASQAYDKVKSGDGPLSGFISGQTQKPGSRLYDELKSGDGPFKNFIPGETQKPLSRLYDSIRAGNHPLGPNAPWRIHNDAVIIRRNFNNYNIFTPRWYRRYPAAWYPAVWYFGDPWIWAPWPTVADYCGYPSQPVYYDYGNNVVFQDNSVLVNGTSVGTPQEYSQEAQQIANDGSDADVSNSDKWLSLGVFAVSEGDDKPSTMVMQLAVDKAGIIRGNYDNTSTKETQVIHGAVDKKALRAAWTIGSHQNIVLDTGIYNLTKQETPVLVHFGDGQTKQWLMVRIDKKAGEASSSDDPTKE